MRLLVWVALLGACTDPDTIAPKLIAFTPSDNADLRGAGTVNILARLSDENDIFADVLADGVSLGGSSRPTAPRPPAAASRGAGTPEICRPGATTCS